MFLVPRERKSQMDWVLSLVTIFLALPFPGRCSHVYSRSDFPEGFAFGSGTSAYQWEGAADEDGRTPSVWETFIDSRNLESGGIACDGYYKYKEDVQLMVETGLDAFRFSISWSRLIPNGRGPINPKGLQFYKSFIQELVTNGIEPHVTLNHFDHPQALEDDYGGWLNRTIIKDFTAYADVCFREFGNHVKFWTTINEANIFTLGGYHDGIAPPGRCSGNYCLSGNSSTEPYIVGHNLLLAHASASRLYRQEYKDMQGGSVGFSLYAIGFYPSTSSKDDEIAAQRARDFFLGWMLGPLVFGDYPYVMRRDIGSRLPHFSEEESELVKGSSDFVGIIHYLAATVTNIKPPYLGYPEFYSDTDVTLTCMNLIITLKSFEKQTDALLFYPAIMLHDHLFFILLHGRTDLCNVSSSGCAPTPWAMEDVLEYIKQSYGNPPLYILENGHSIKGDLQLQEKDTPRIEYLHDYIGAVLKAVKNGSDTRGYFVWSFMDLFELLGGYDSSFGLYYVNFSDPQRKRSPKLSAHWYSAFLKGDTTSLDSQGIAQLPSNLSSSSF